MMNKKQGFTFSEMLITMGIMAVILMILIPAVKNLQPNQSLVMFKKAYYVAERVVSELVNDDDYYPLVDDPDVGPFLANTEYVPCGNGNSNCGGNQKFCQLFSKKLNISTDASCVKRYFVDGALPKGQFTTTDGVVWILPITSFEDLTGIGYAVDEIQMDVNGDRGPNCFYNESKCSAPDRFSINIYQNGRLTVTGKREKQYLHAKDVSKTAGDFDKEEKEKQQQGN